MAKSTSNGRIIFILIILKLLVIAIIFAVGYLTTSVEGPNTSLDKQAIETVWKTYYGKYAAQQEKVKLLSEAYKKEYLSNIEAAYLMPESKLRRLSFEDKLNILTRRQIIDSLDVNYSEIKTFEKAFEKIETTSTELIPTHNGLKEIIFTNEKEAYGVFQLFLSDKSNQFVKEGNDWKINPSKEHFKFLLSRKLLKSKYINEYGSEDAAIEEMIKLTTGSKANWQPLSN